jgi:hypothetical protein
VAPSAHSPIYPDATPMLLQDQNAHEAWMNAPWELAKVATAARLRGRWKVRAADRKQDEV